MKFNKQNLKIFLLNFKIGRLLLKFYHFMKSAYHHLKTLIRARKLEKKIKPIKFSFYSVYEWAQSNKAIASILNEYSQEPVIRGGYSVYDNIGKQTAIEKEQVIMLPYYLARLPNSWTLSQTSFIIHGDNLLYDYKKQIVEHNALSKHYDQKISGDFSSNCIYLKRYPKSKSVIAKGISLFEDYQFNYYHWLLEVLPKLLMIERRQDLEDYPLLVPKSLPYQFYESLEFITEGHREIIKLNSDELYRVRDLIYLSNLSVTNEVVHRVPRINDYCISDVAIDYLRQKCNSLFSQQAPTKLLYIERRSQYRKLLNENEIKNMASSLNFESINCADFSFKDQVKLFSQAKFILGPTGAGFTNLVFNQTATKALIMLPGHSLENLEIFNTIARPLEISLAFLKGHSAQKTDIHSDYTIDCRVLDSILTKLLTGEG